MTEKEAFYAGQQQMECFERDGFVCQNCGQSIYSNHTPQTAHRICKSKINLETYGPEIIHHKFNLVSVCCLFCNGKFNIDNQTASKMALINKIKEDLEARDTWEKQTRQSFKDLIK